MRKKSLGIDISDSQIAGVVLEQQGKSLTMSACLALPLPEGADRAEHIRLLCEQLEWREGVCVCGLPLSVFNIRNLTLPFRDARKIAQALPFELEEQLIVPVDTLVTDFFLSKTTDTDSQIVAFVTEKSFLSNLLNDLQGGADPEIITPAVLPLAAQIRSHSRESKNLLLLDTDLHSITMVFLLGDTPLFCRRLSYPEQIIMHFPFSPDSGEEPGMEMADIEQGIRLLCSSIERSLDYFHQENHTEIQPERVVLTGALAETEAVAAMMASTLHLPVETMDLLATDMIGRSEEMRSQGQSWRFDRAVALALLGLGKKPQINFRTEAFAKKRSLFSSRKQLVGMVTVAAVVAGCFLGYMGYDYRRLQSRDKVVREEMTVIFKETFPHVTKVHEPYTEMKAALKTVQGPESPTPLFASGKRVLGLLADISARIPETVTLQVSRLAIDRESVQLKGTTDTFNSVNIIKNSLAASSGYRSVQIVSATADKAKNSGIIRFEIHLQL